MDNPFFQEKSATYEIQRTFSIHFDYQAYSYPEGDVNHSCKVIYPVPQMPEQTIEVEHQYEGFDTLMEHIWSDLQAYLEDPKDWTALMIRGGTNNAMKLKQLQLDLHHEKENKAWNQKRIEDNLRRIENIKKEIEDIKKEIEKAEK